MPHETTANAEATTARPLLRLGIRGRVFVWYVALLVLAAVGSLLLQRQLLMHQANRALDEETTEEVRQLQVRIEQGQDPSTLKPWPDVESAFDSFLTRTVPEVDEGFITFVEGRLHRDDQRIMDLPEIRHLSTEWSQLPDSRTGRAETSRGAIRYRATPIRHAGQDGTFVATILEERQTGPIATAMRVGAIVWISVLAVASVLAWMLIGRLLRPVGDLTDTAEEINETDLSRRIPVRTEDELGRLTRTFNAMLDRLESAFRTQKEFIDVTSHELRTPLTVARGQVELLKMDPSDLEDTVDVVLEELDRMARLVNDLLLLARAERPGFLELENVDLAELTTRAFDKARTLSDRD
jgi:methyl-accepting chemotaxis protein